jgi:hypothetical protein
VGGAFVSLALARYLTGSGFLLALFGLALCLSSALHASVAGALFWATRSARTPALAAALVSAAMALAGRAALKVTLGLDPESAHRIDPFAIGAAAIALTGALAGVAWSVVVLARRPTPGWPAALAATVGVSACLYTLGPLLLSIGLPVGPWTFSSLAAVGVLFYGARRALSRS